MAGNPKASLPRAVGSVIALMAGLGLCWLFPLFRIVPLKAPGVATVGPSGVGSFDPAAAAKQIWQKDLPAAAVRALELDLLAPALQADPKAARAKFARSTGLGTAYYFVRGRGRVVARDRNQVRVALAGAEPAVVALRIGPVFGNTVRDGFGLLDVNSFPGLTEFNALAAALNALVEKNVIPGLRDRAVVGAEVQFAGCAEAPDSAAGAGEPLLIVIPVQAEVR